MLKIDFLYLLEYLYVNLIFRGNYLCFYGNLNCKIYFFVFFVNFCHQDKFRGSKVKIRLVDKITAFSLNL